MKKELTCLRCEYVWTPRVKNKPKQCPRCKSYAYDKEREVREGKVVEKYVPVPWPDPPKEERW